MNSMRVVQTFAQICHDEIERNKSYAFYERDKVTVLVFRNAGENGKIIMEGLAFI